jgi:DUF917 family protein
MPDLKLDEVPDLALGAGVLGGGGGGDPYLAQLLAQALIRETGPVQLWDVDEVSADALVVASAYMGAPMVMAERLPQGDKAARAVRSMERHLGRAIAALISAEIGGINGLTPVITASHLGLPLVDADYMGRAFPDINMTLADVYGVAATPMVMVDDRGNQVILETVDNVWTETLSRSATVDMGGAAMIALYPMTGEQLRQTAVPGSISRAIRIGRALRQARADSRNPVRAVRETAGGIDLFRGKMVDVHRQLQAGLAQGEALLEGTGTYLGQRMTIHFQNEYLLAAVDRRMIATVPDTIVVLDARTGSPVPAEASFHGLDVVVLGIPCVDAWRTPAGLALVGPRAFGYDVDYRPLTAAR